MPETQSTTEDKRHSLLVVDDSDDVHRLLQARLRQENIDLIAALDGKTSLVLAEQEHPSLILLDLDMPDMDGFEVLRHLKDNSETRDIPVIVLSGLHSPADKVVAFDLGAVDYVTKPFDLMELRVRLRSALRMSDLIEMLGKLAHIDGLTGLWNRAHFDDRWGASISENHRSGRSLSMRSSTSITSSRSTTPTVTPRVMPPSRALRSSSNARSAPATSRAATAEKSSR